MPRPTPILAQNRLDALMPFPTLKGAIFKPRLFLMSRRMAVFLALLLSLLSPGLMAGSEPVRFAPLPLENPEATIKAFAGVVERLQTLIERPVALVYHEDYDEILSGLAQGKIDIAFLGPLPYVMLLDQGVPLEPLVLFREANGQARYRCALIHFRGETSLDTPLSGRRLAMTQRSSTCGYLGAASLLHDLAGLSPEDLLPTYVGSHEKVALAVVDGQADVGSLKEEFFTKYQELGLGVLGFSPWMPGIGLFANTENLSAPVRARLKAGLLDTPSTVYTHWGNAMRHGMAEAESVPFEAFRALVRAFGPDRLPRDTAK